MKKTNCAATIGVILLCLSVRAPAEDWPHWCGADASGVSREHQLPLRSSPTENIAWKAKLAGDLQGFPDSSVRP